MVYLKILCHLYNTTRINEEELHMKKFWSKKLPAFLLALVLVAGMMPAALAAGCQHNSWGNWAKLNDEQHQRKCDVSGCNGTQEANHTWPTAYKTETQNHWKECSDCGAQSAKEHHTYGTALKSDANYHWNECSVCGYKENMGGHVDLNLDSKCDTFKKTVNLDAVSVTFMNGTATYKTAAKLAKGSCPANPGTPTKAADSTSTYTFKGWTTRNPGPSAMYDRQTYLTSSQVASTPLTASTVYYALYEAVEIPSVIYEVNPGEALVFDRSDFRDIFDEVFDDDTFRSVTFTADRSLKDSNGILYVCYGDKRDEEEFSRDDLADFEFYYKSDVYGDYAINDLSFVADEDADGKAVTLTFTLHGDDNALDGTLTINIGEVEQEEKSGPIVYKVDPDKTVTFDRADFQKFFQEENEDDTFRYVTFYPDNSLTSSRGVLYYDYDGDDEEEFEKEDLSGIKFYHKSEKYGDYPISSLTFVADEDADGKTVTLEFVVSGDEEDYTGKLTILIGTATVKEEGKGDIEYTVAPEEEVEFDRADFNKFFKAEYSNTLRYVTFYPDKTLKSSNGTLYIKYSSRNEVEFEKDDLEGVKFYYSDEEYGDYDLDDLSFVAGEDFDEVVTLEFRAWYDEEKYVDGLVTVTSVDLSESESTADILFSTTAGTALQINANTIARFFKEQHPSSTLESVTLTGVPKTGSLHYDYYNSKNAKELTKTNCDDEAFYLDPGKNQKSLSALTYIPKGSNYCVSIPFTAAGSGKKAAEGTILISVTNAAVSEVYGVTPKNTTVTLPASAIYSAVYSATGTALSSIQLLEMPDSTVGSVNISGGYVSTKADTDTKYTYASGSNAMSNLRFVPASNYTGSAEIPYVAYDKNGNAIAWGKFCVGVVSSVKKFSDIASSTWCYKYVTELSDAGVIGGYTDGSFKPNDTVTYGAALKLVMLAAGYSEQAPVSGGHTFSGYLAKAKSDGLVSGNIDLSKPITRLQIAQLAAKAMELSTGNLPSTKPFTDTSDVYVQALNAAGIIEGYFANGSYTYKPSNTLTRGQLSAIVWRMRNYD